MSLLEIEKPLKTSAAGQYLGYSLQQLRLCHHLLKVQDGDIVSLEYLDDIAVHRSNGTLLLEQSKSALTGNPAANRSIELWKSFANWGELCKSKRIDGATTDFRLYVTPTKTGDLIKLLHAAVDPNSVDNVLGKIKKLVNPSNLGVGCTPQVIKFLGFGDHVCRLVIQNFQFVTETEPVESVREYVRAGVPVDALDELASAAIGMARDQIDRLIREKTTPAISATKFRRSFQTFSQRSILTNFLPSKVPKLSDGAIHSVISTAPKFVQQLQAVDASEGMLITAVSDYLRATADKVYWADEGFIVEESLVDLDAQLVRNHSIIRDEIEDTQVGANERGRGRALYRRCATTVLPLDGRVVPSHFIAGTYNNLADHRLVGWHPQYEQLFPLE